MLMTTTRWFFFALLSNTLLVASPGRELNAAEPPPRLRPPAVPLITHDPYFSVWSPADRLTDADTMHWTGKPHRLISLVQIDGKPFRVMGKEAAADNTRWKAGTAPNVPPLPQTNLEVLPTRTIYTFEGAGIRLTLTFMTPLLPSDLDTLSRPVTYVTWDVVAVDNASHSVKANLDIHPEIAANDPGQTMKTSAQQFGELVVLGVGTVEQPVLQKKGDDLRIDWGQLYLATAHESSQCQRTLLQADRGEWWVTDEGSPPTKAAPKEFTPSSDTAQVLTAYLDFGTVTAKPVSRWLMLAYDDEYSIKYFRQNLRPYWRRQGADAAALLRKAAAEYPSLKPRCEEFDAQLMADLRQAGGEQYAQVCALAYRQTFAGNKVVADASGMPLMFPKENFSNGCIGTVDVLYPQAPFFLVLSPALTKAMLVPVLDYARSPRWPYPYAPHDLGTYPHATGQVYGMNGSDGERMPVEESGNMLIMMAALAKVEGNAALAEEYWPLLTEWADYLVKEGLDPVNQLCTADMFGHLAHNADLSLKAIIGIGGYAQMAVMLGKQADAEKYFTMARDYAARWQQMAKDAGRTRLAFDRPGTWGMKHNLIWDRVLGLNLFPNSIADQEIAWYLKAQNPYGLPCDNRTEQSLIDWAVWCVALAREDRDWQALFYPLFRYVHETPDRVPMSDWFFTTNARRRGFQARPVVGGIFMKLLLETDVAKRYTAHAAKIAGQWSPAPIPGALREVVPTARTAEARWRYTFEPPGPGWFQSAFDDSAWKKGAGGFGTRGTPGAIIGTEWNTTNIWLRREFTLPDRKLKNPMFLIHYDEAPEVYLNGVLAARLTGWSSQYGEADIAPAALAALRPGKNVMAVRASQTYGGQYIDVGLVEEAK